MKVFRIKTIFFIGVLSVIGLVGLSGVAMGQGNSQNAHRKNRIRKAEKQMEKDARRYEKDARKYRVYRNGSYYQTDYRGAELLRQAVRDGYRQGYNVGIRDRRYRRTSGYYGSPIYRSGNYGYRSYVDRSQYQYYFQQGFERGYEDGFNSRLNYGYRTNNGYSILGSILGAILNIREY